jgi:uncharacterized protein (TIGR02646 family)
MKYISKQSQPERLLAWIHSKEGYEKGVPVVWSYNDMPSDVREAVKVSLIREQGALCCYTGRRITLETSHIEHLKPQDLCVNHEDTDYLNLLAAYPGSNDHEKCEYGAHAKKNWYKEHEFVHPRRRDCETRFSYRLDGKIAAHNKQDEAAKETISQLRLDHRKLEGLREAAIHAALFEQRLSKGQAERLLAKMDERLDDKFPQFCFVIKQACQKYLKRFDR